MNSIKPVAKHYVYKYKFSVSTECLNGYESLDGSPCSPCPKGLYGKDCLKTCYCKNTEYTDQLFFFFCFNMCIIHPPERWFNIFYKKNVHLGLNWSMEIDEIRVITEASEPIYIEINELDLFFIQSC